MSPARVQARRFLHCCYCCADALEASHFFEDGLGLELRMRSAGQRVDGTQMGFPGEVEADACFVYDRRGPRVAPAIEVQAWIDPPTEGVPYPTPQHVGFQALGFAVPSADHAVEHLVQLGSRLVERDGSGARLQDPTGVALDLVERDDVDGDSRFVHLRATCTDLDRSVAWCATLGFEKTARSGGERVSSARLALPDEPFALVLEQWHDPPSTGTPYAMGNHAGLYRFAVAVDDTRAAYEELRKDWGLSSPPRSIALGGTNVPDMWIAFLADPDGLVVELVERPRSVFG